MIGSLIDSTEIAPGIFALDLRLQRQTFVPGAIYRLKSKVSSTLFPRVFSLWNVSIDSGADKSAVLTFLIQVKGRGTAELAKLKAGDELLVEGAIGNSYPMPKKSEKILIVSGGIGIASAGGFAHSLGGDVDYDFTACFKSSSYGLEHIGRCAKKVTLVTEDGSQGLRGMLPDALPPDDAQNALSEYAAVYACGPEPMLAYIQKLCAAAGKPCFVSVEANMACAVGACLGCAVRTLDGNKKVCVDGPVFAGEKLVFPLDGKSHGKPNGKSHGKTETSPRLPPHSSGSCGEVVDLSVTLSLGGGGKIVRFKNPLILASGTAGYGSEYRGIVDFAHVGGICSKGLTLNARSGNTGIRILETPAGLLNSIGLENPGVPHFIAHELPAMLALEAETDTVVIANLSGECEDDYVRGAELLDKTCVKMIEVNISCPNVKSGGMAFGLVPDTAAALIAAVRRATSKPLIVKLSPNASDIAAVADAVRAAGADALSLINTVQAMAIDIEKAAPLFDNTFAGLSGPAVKPLALRLVYTVARALQKLPESERIPIIALGGISTWQDAAEFIMAGASAFQVGTAFMANPAIAQEITIGLTAFMQRKGYKNIEQMRGAALR
ncbi:MAG: hypothetical protein Ta2A_10180 [Treponemataceae bacterium]|nr:MAG: hypothetical protein Ta2A_10180 [Treponemataceae bacterium]